jgi:lipopolysaccharide biosynthesis glycosyltransferase
MLPQLLPDLDKIIYADTDIIFCRDLLDIDCVDLHGNFIAGVKDTANIKKDWDAQIVEGFRKSLRTEYICSGFLLMNLYEIRKNNIYDEWTELSKYKKLIYPDQDIINHSCGGKKLFLPLKYSFFTRVNNMDYHNLLKENIYSHEEYIEAENHASVIHYTGRKPWSSPGTLSDLWWKYAKLTPFYEELQLNYLVSPKSEIRKKYLLFNVLPLLSSRSKGGKAEYYLLGFIPFLKIKG